MSNIELYWGDCLKIMDGLIADGVKVDAIISDIPYGISIDKWDILHDNTNSALLGSSPAQEKYELIYLIYKKPLSTPVNIKRGYKRSRIRLNIYVIIIA